MSLLWHWVIASFSLAFSFVDSQNNTAAERYDYPSANLSTIWVNNPDLIRNVNYTSALIVRPILLFNRFFGTRYACGFYKNGTAGLGYTFGVFMVEVNSGSRITSANVLPQPVWSANRNRLVGENSTLELTAAGNLILRDEQNVEVWSTNTTGMGVVSMEMQESGNLVLLSGRNESVWQSFDHPTDVLVLGQTLKAGMKLTSSISDEEPAEGSFFLEMKDSGLYASARSQKYWSGFTGKNLRYVMFVNGSLVFFTANGNDSRPLQDLPGPQYLKLLPDGSLAVFGRSSSSVGNWGLAYSIMESKDCGLPSSCGKYGICNRGDCSCASLFTSLDPRRPSFGCKLATPLADCNSETQNLIQVHQVDYLPLTFDSSGTEVDSLEKCREICMGNCSCKAAFYRGTSCYAFDEVYTIRNASYLLGNVSTIALLKVRKNVSTSIRRRSSGVIIGSIIAALVLVLAMASVIVVLIRRRIRRQKEMEELVLDSTPGLPRRFTYKQLQDATKDFSRKLGQGGFGSVFFGVLSEQGEVAIKRLESANQGQKEFRTEVGIIGSIQHINLVQLKGFCAERNERLLVYELFAKGSLDKWLFSKEKSTVLDSKTRFKIALGTARGLAYLHEECREKIIHLDIKPQNILLDDDFSAKVCDFGMSKLMKREESAVFTTMRGTPGYLAPEWLQSSITEKVDVYSYGIVLLELVSGMKCLDATRADPSKIHFPSWACQRISKGALEEVVDENLREEYEMGEENGDKIQMLVRIAMWCIQNDPGSRPSMGVVVQMLEGVLDVPEPPVASLDQAAQQDDGFMSNSMEVTLLGR